MNKEFYVYIHYRDDTNEPFYVGKGYGRRAYIAKGRSKWWQSIAAKHTVRVEILEIFNTEQEAFMRETSLISSMNASGIRLCNLTSGGEGACGRIVSEETRQIMREKMTGRSLSDEAKRKVGLSSKQRRHTDARKAKMSTLFTGVNNPSYKGAIVATNVLTGESLEITGRIHMESLGFHPPNVYNCLAGTRKTHKGYTFTR